MQCSLCKETIDDDSRYCDQCGEQILVCSVCGRLGKGKRCVFDGKELIPAGSGSPAFSTTASVSAPQVQSVQPIHLPHHIQPVQPAQYNVGDKVKLTSQMHGIMIEVTDSDIIGRKNGAFAGVFSRFNFVSGTHCKFIKNAAGWHIQDMGSTNGTFYNGNQLTPNMLYSISNNTIVNIADIEFHVTYDSDTEGTSRL